MYLYVSMLFVILFILFYRNFFPQLAFISLACLHMHIHICNFFYIFFCIFAGIPPLAFGTAEYWNFLQLHFPLTISPLFFFLNTPPCIVEVPTNDRWPPPFLVTAQLSDQRQAFAFVLIFYAILSLLYAHTYIYIFEIYTYKYVAWRDSAQLGSDSSSGSGLQ